MRSWISALLVVGAILGMAEEASAQRCFVAFVHGRGNDRTNHSQDQLENEYWNGTPGSTYASFTYYGAQVRGCTVTRVGYNGGVAFWEDGAAMEVARELNDFISANQIVAGELTIVGHSMGGLVTRWILNNGVPNSPYYNYRGANYARIVGVTRALVTVQSPHTGTEAADTLCGEADSWYSSAAGAVIRLIGMDSCNQSARYMTRATMGAAGGNGGWMGDGGRTRRMYTIAGFTTFDGAGGSDGETSDLALAWGGLCNRSHGVNVWLCGEDEGEQGDGLVEEWSAMGRRRYYDEGDWYALYLNSGWEWDSSYVAGARTDWLRVEHDHHEGRHDDWTAQIRNCSEMSCGSRSSQSSAYSSHTWLGSYVGQRIRALAM